MPSVIWQEPGSDATGDLSPYSSTVGTVVSDTLSKIGPRSIKCSSGNPAGQAFVRRAGVLADASRRLTFWFMFDVLPGAASSSFLALETSGGTSIAVLDINTDGTIRIRPIGATAVSGAVVLSVLTWYRVTLSYTITNTATFRFELYLNGAFEATATAGTLTGTGTAQVRYGVGSANWGDDRNLWFDNPYIDDGTDYADPGDRPYRNVATLPHLRVGDGMSISDQRWH